MSKVSMEEMAYLIEKAKAARAALDEAIADAARHRGPVFDFDDGKGPVPAHRHKNPDGSVGGWVANTADVRPGAYIGRDARVCGYVWIDGGATILDTAKVCDNVWVFRGAIILGNAKVDGSRWVYSNDVIV